MAKETEKARNYAYKLLEFRLRTRFEIEKKLKEKGFTEEVITDVVNRLIEYKFIDDRQFADMWVKNRCRLKPMGKWRLRQELKLKGINEHIIEDELANITAEEEYRMAEQLVAKKLFKSQYSKKQLTAFLIRRGFSREIINNITNGMME